MLVLSLSLVSVLLAGCNGDKEEKPAPKAAQTQPAKQTRVEKTELMPENSGEFSRRHVSDEFGRKIETHTRYRNGDDGSKFFHSNGLLKEEVLRDKSGKIKQQRAYARDGKTMISGMESRSDGTEKWTLSQNADGSTTKKTFWFDGKRIFSEELTRADGSVEQKFFRKDGTLWVKKTGANASELVSEHYTRTGVMEARSRVLSDGSTEVLRYENGQLTYRQLWKKEQYGYSYGYSTWNLITVDEFDGNGKTVRTIVMSKGGYTVVETRTVTADGGYVVKRLRWSGEIEVEETFDSAGQSTGRKTLSEPLTKENIDNTRLRRIENKDAMETWQQQEDYPYMRDQD